MGGKGHERCVWRADGEECEQKSRERGGGDLPGESQKLVAETALRAPSPNRFVDQSCLVQTFPQYSATFPNFWAVVF